MELDWLETFLAVVDRGGFTAASEQVHRSQSRVSAHIAALERDLGVQLIDRTRRPATLTAAGDVFVRYARDLVARVGSARTAVGALRWMDAEALRVLTTPCIGSAMFPEVLGELVQRFPGVRLALTQRSAAPDGNVPLPDGYVLAVLPKVDGPLPPGVCERMLWRERMRIVVRPDHELARHDGGVRAEELVRYPLVVCGAASETVPEAVAMLAERGLAAQPRAAVDSPLTVLALVRAGAGVGMLNGVALETADTDGLVVLDTDDPGMGREVAAYWHDGVVAGGAAMELHRIVLDTEAPPGSEPLPAPEEPDPGADGSHNGRIAPPRR